jgi:hypothetical protein
MAYISVTAISGFCEMFSYLLQVSYYIFLYIGDDMSLCYYIFHYIGDGMSLCLLYFPLYW